MRPSVFVIATAIAATVGCTTDDRPPPPSAHDGGGVPIDPLEAGQASDVNTTACTAAQPPLGGDPLSDHSFPDVTLTACNGDSVRFDEVRCGAAYTFVSIGTGWCEPCIEEAPLLDDLGARFADRSLQVVQVLFEDAEREPASAAYCGVFQSQTSIQSTVYADPSAQTIREFDPPIIPRQLLVDRTGKVLLSIPGALPSDIDARIEQALPAN